MSDLVANFDPEAYLLKIANAKLVSARVPFRNEEARHAGALALTETLRTAFIGKLKEDFMERGGCAETAADQLVGIIFEKDRDHTRRFCARPARVLFGAAG